MVSLTADLLISSSVYCSPSSQNPLYIFSKRENVLQLDCHYLTLLPCSLCKLFLFHFCILLVASDCHLCLWQVWWSLSARAPVIASGSTHDFGHNMLLSFFPNLLLCSNCHCLIVHSSICFCLRLLCYKIWSGFPLFLNFEGNMTKYAWGGSCIFFCMCKSLNLDWVSYLKMYESYNS